MRAKTVAVLLVFALCGVLIPPAASSAAPATVVGLPPAAAVPSTEWLLPDANGLIRYPTLELAQAPTAPSESTAHVAQADEFPVLDFASDVYQRSREFSVTGATLIWSSIWADDAWVSVSPTTLTIPAGESRTVTVTVDRFGLPDGTAQSRVRLQRSTGIQDSFRVSAQVATWLLEGADFGTLSGAAQFTLQIPQQLALIPFRWQVQSRPDWMSVSPSAGTLPAGSGEQTINLAVTVDPVGLAAGQYTSYMVWTTMIGHYLFPFRVTVPSVPVNSPTPTSTRTRTATPTRTVPPATPRATLIRVSADFTYVQPGETLHVLVDVRNDGGAGTIWVSAAVKDYPYVGGLCRTEAGSVYLAPGVSGRVRLDWVVPRGTNGVYGLRAFAWSDCWFGCMASPCNLDGCCSGY
jgi:hypothetical protein